MAAERGDNWSTTEIKKKWCYLVWFG